MGIDKKRYTNEHDRKYVPVNFSRRYNDLLALIRLTGAFPLTAIRSQAYAAPKNNSKQGIKGQRILHCFDSFGMSYFGYLQRTSRRPRAPDFAHGGIRGRRREGAILSLSAACWRCRTARISHS
eukprot:7235831-Pyramimonas_sp.AAC.1